MNISEKQKKESFTVNYFIILNANIAVVPEYQFFVNAIIF